MTLSRIQQLPAQHRRPRCDDFRIMIHRIETIFRDSLHMLYVHHVAMDQERIKKTLYFCIIRDLKCAVQ